MVQWTFFLLAAAATFAVSEAVPYRHDRYIEDMGEFDDGYYRHYMDEFALPRYHHSMDEYVPHHYRHQYYGGDLYRRGIFDLVEKRAVPVPPQFLMHQQQAEDLRKQMALHHG